jgi:hypothetical protein
VARGHSPRRDSPVQERRDIAEFEQFMAIRRGPGCLTMVANDCRRLWDGAADRSLRWLLLLAIPATLLDLALMGERLYVYAMTELAGIRVGISTPVQDLLLGSLPPAAGLPFFAFLLLGLPGTIAVGALLLSLPLIPLLRRIS